MPDCYDLTRVLEEIIEDEKVTTSKRKRISQADIKRLFSERKKAAARRTETGASRIGDLLIQHGLISPEQLLDALEIHTQRGGKLGSALVELGYLSASDLVEFLGKQQSVPGADLFQVAANENFASVLPRRVISRLRVLPLRVDAQTIQLGMETPKDFAAIHEVEFLTGRRVLPVVVPSYQMDLALKCVEEKGGVEFTPTDMQEALQTPITTKALLEKLVGSNGSDLFITADSSPSLRVRGVLSRTDLPVLSADQCVAYAKSLMNESQWELFLKEKDFGFCQEIDGLGRFRTHVYRQRNTISVAIRRLRPEIPTFVELGLPACLEDYVLKPQGLILVTGATGQGKTTTLASMVDLINRKRHANVITLEHPIEYVHNALNCDVNQREIGVDTDSIADGLRRIFRQAPDVIVIGELDSREACEGALQAASTGHLVLGALHARSATSAITGLVQRFPNHRQPLIRERLADVLVLAFAQRLVPRKASVDMALAYEKLVASPRIKSLIRDNSLQEIAPHGDCDDYIPIDESLRQLVEAGVVAQEDLVRFLETEDREGLV